MSAGRITVMRELLAGGARINRTDTKGLTALHRAVYYEDIEFAIIMLLSCGADINQSRASVSLVDRSDGDGDSIGDGYDDTISSESALSIAARECSIEMVELLLRFGADVNYSASMTGVTPLLVAVGAEKTDCALRLLSAGADVHACDSDGRNALHLASELGDVTFVEAIIARHSSDAALFLSGCADGYTPLHYACSEGNLTTATVLLALPIVAAHVNARTMTEGLTPFMLAQRCDPPAPDLVAALVAAGAKTHLLAAPVSIAGARSPQKTDGSFYVM